MPGPNLVGDYRYSGCELAGSRYAVIHNGAVVERVRILTPTGNPVIWRDGEPMTDLILTIISACK